MSPPSSAHASALLGAAWDIVEGRVEESVVPAWCVARGWAPFLLGLDDGILARCESDGLTAELVTEAGGPGSLRAFLEALAEASALPHLDSTGGGTPLHEARGASVRKVPQLEVLLDALARMAPEAARIVDVGAGRGALSRLVASRFERPVVGLERSFERVERATAMASFEGVEGVHFEACDALAEAFELAPGDLALGLHACGELGDHLVRLAAAHRADLLLVPCCPQKLRASVREPLSETAPSLRLPRGVLGLANLTSQPHGVEVPMGRTMESREARFALRGLLRRRGVALAPGEEMRGLNRKRARGDFALLAASACEARGLAPPSVAELDACLETARIEHGVVRRLSLPRSAMGRLLEVAVAQDRASFLAERGHAVVLCTFVERAVTPRNIALFASLRPERLPSVRPTGRSP